MTTHRCNCGSVWTLPKGGGSKAKMPWCVVGLSAQEIPPSVQTTLVGGDILDFSSASHGYIYTPAEGALTAPGRGIYMVGFSTRYAEFKGDNIRSDLTPSASGGYLLPNGGGYGGGDSSQYINGTSLWITYDNNDYFYLRAYHTHAAPITSQEGYTAIMIAKIADW